MYPIVDILIRFSIITIMEKGSRHTGKKIALHPRIIANEAYLANPNIVRGNQPPVNPNREIEQMLRSVTPR